MFGVNNNIFALFALFAGIITAQEHEGHTKLFVVGGFSLDQGGGDSADVELINLSFTDVECVKPADFPFASEGAIIFLADYEITGEAPVVCGGRLGDTELQDCYLYDASAASWDLWGSMIVGRSWAAPGVKVGRGSEVWVSGGRVSLDEEVSDTSELINVATGMSREAPGLTLPSPRCLHCAVALNSSHVFLSGGGYKDPDTQEYSFMSDAYVVDVTDPDSPVWTIMPSMGEARGGHACGVVDDEIVVTGNFIGQSQATEIFSMSTLEWRFGEDTLEISQPAYVAFDPTFIVIGGYIEDSEGTIVDTANIRAWVAGNSTWADSPRGMDSSRDTMEAIMVPDSICMPPV